MSNNNQRRKAECPFKGKCIHSICADHDLHSCEVEDKKPLIICSLAEFKTEEVELTREGIREYLKRHVKVWKDHGVNYPQSTFAIYFKDVYRKVGQDLLGEDLEDDPGRNPDGSA